MLNKWADDLHMAALNLGDLLPEFTRAFAMTRNRAVDAGRHNVAAFYGELAAFCADTRDHYNQSVKDMQHDYLDSHIRVVADELPGK